MSRATPDATGQTVLPSARAAGRADGEALAATMARAFQDDPFVSHLVPGAEARIRKLPALFGLLFRLGLPFGACDVTGGVKAAALWRPPGKWHVPFWQYLTNGPALLAIFGTNTLGALSAVDTLEKHHPRKPHWYLQAIGTDPALQGKGYGGVLLRHRLAMIDALGHAAYLESSKEANVPLYANFGFVLMGEIRIANGPILYPMWRDPVRGTGRSAYSAVR